MNILILHQMGNPKRWLKSVADLELALPNNDTRHNYLVHNTLLKFPEFLKDFAFDGIILNSTFLDARHERNRFNRILKEYSFIKESGAIKIALAQDDYDCNLELDKWMVDWNVDYFYSVIHESSEELFPSYSRMKGPVLKGYTGYISKEHLSLAKNSTKSLKDRSIDVGYRSTDVVTNLNRLVILKATIGKTFTNKFYPYNLNLNISSKNEDRIYGRNWFKFIEDCRFMIGTNSGSSLIIPDLDFKEKIQEYLDKTPNWQYNDVKNLFFKDQDETITYTAISPRNIEASILGTCQINTTLGNYSDLLKPWEHFIPIEEQCENHLEVFEAMSDLTYVRKTVASAKDSLLSANDLRLDNFIELLLTQLENSQNTTSSKSTFIKVKAKYLEYIGPIERIQWGKELLKDKVKWLINYKTKGNRIS